MAFAETAKLAVQIDLGGNASAGLRGLQKQVNGLGSSVGRVGKGFGQLGAGVARAGLVVGGAAIAGLTGAAKAAIEFEDAFAGVVKTVDEADLAKAGLTFDDLSDSFRGLATEIPITAVEFARLGEAAGALGVDAKDIETFVKTTAMLGVTTDLSADQAADALGRIGTILDFTGKDYENFADSLVALGNAGASVESEIIEISKRFAAEGNAAGLATSEIAGLASATASLGFAPERGGTALSRVFANMATNISTANGAGKALSKGLGRSIKDLQSDIDRGKGLDIFLDVLGEIRDLSPTEAARFLKSIGVTNTSDRTIFRTMADNLPFVNDQLEIAKDATGALLEEATKKFATTASKIQLFKNNVIEAGITVGEQFLPAVNRALDKVIDVFKDPGTKGDLKQLGQSIGEAIDDIDWKQVVSGAKAFAGVLKSALDVSLAILRAIEALPTEVKAAGLALVGLNKVSGGLIGAGLGNILGGLGETIVRGLGSQLPGVGKLFAQPVFVTNWPLGGMGGGLPGAAAGIGAGTLLAGAAVTAIAGAAVIAVQQQLSNENTATSAGIKSNLEAGIGGKTTAELRTALQGVQQGIAELSSNPLYALVQGEALDNLRSMEASLQAAIAGKTGMSPDERQEFNDQKSKLSDIALQVQRKGEQTTTSIGKTTAAALETKRETGRGASIVAATTRAGSANIVNALGRMPVPIVNVNVTASNVTKSITYQERVGPGTGSAGGGPGAGHNGPTPV